MTSKYNGFAKMTPEQAFAARSRGGKAAQSNPDTRGRRFQFGDADTARKGGLAAQATGRCHKWNKASAGAAGRKGAAVQKARKKAALVAVDQESLDSIDTIQDELDSTKAPLHGSDEECEGE